ncbi:MAG: L-serine ammonia-lyase, iron-sulfur-dependent, subunit alpha [Pygmaiobacter sp.]
MDQTLYQNHLAVLKDNLKPALGCTEPIAVAYAAAKARELLNAVPCNMTVECSGNIIKNVNGVVVPNSDRMKGVDVAAVLGAVGGDASRRLEVLEGIKKTHIDEAARLIAQGFCHCSLVEGVENLYIRVFVESADGHSAEVVLRDYHTNITHMEHDGTVLLDRKEHVSTTSVGETDTAGQPALLSLENILDFATTVQLEDIKEVIGTQISCNVTLAEEGLQNPWGTEVGRTLLAAYGDQDVRVRARAAAAAGSDARMSGCTLPAVINSGSGNQGITVTLPVVEYARALNASQEKLYRALTLANLISIHQKKQIGSLSAYCGAVSAATGAACGIAYLQDQPFSVLCDTIVNSIATIGGMVCDGAKPSCAAKISVAVENALNALEMAKRQRVFQPGEGIVKRDAEETIKSVGRMAREGMRSTDVEILNIMLEHDPL